MLKDHMKYVENLKIYQHLDNINYNPKDSKEYVLKSLNYIALKKRQIHNENNSILEDVLEPIEKNGIQSELEYEILDEFQAGLALELGSLDNEIFFRIHKLMLAYAQKNGDLNEIIKEIYYCGYCEYVHQSSIFFNKQLTYFNSVVQYADKYGDLSITGRNFLLRCYSNCILDGSNDYKRAMDIYKYVLDKKQRYPSEYIAYDSYLLSISRNLSSFLYVFRQNDSNGIQTPKEALKFVYERSIQSLNSFEPLNKEVLTKIINYEYYYYAAAFHYQQITIDELLDKLDELTEIEEGQFSFEDNTDIISMNVKYMQYYILYKNADKGELINALFPRTKRLIKLMSKIPISEMGDNFDLSIISFIKLASLIFPFKLFKDIFYSFTTIRYRSTYIHVEMVRRICVAITKNLLKNNPEFFVGIIDDYSLDYIKRHNREILGIIDDMAMFHDVGKHMLMKYISLAHRKLFENELELIRLHPTYGCLLMNKDVYPKYIYDAILLHHLWHDGKAGYPADAVHTNNQPLVDILAVADSIDAATDYVGRPYTFTKTLDNMKKELNNYLDTRYSSVVVKALDDPLLLAEIQNIITVQRENVAYKIYTGQKLEN